jgi:hypothetical protein
MRGNRGRRRIPTRLVLIAGTAGADAGAVAWAWAWAWAWASGQNGWAAALAAAGLMLTVAGYLADRTDPRPAVGPPRLLEPRPAQPVRLAGNAV